MKARLTELATGKPLGIVCGVADCCLIVSVSFSSLAVTIHAYFLGFPQFLGFKAVLSAMMNLCMCNVWNVPSSYADQYD